MSEEILVDVVIPHFRGKEILVRCLDALKASLARGDVPCEVHVVDNAATDGSIEQAVERHPWVHVIRSPENLGFAGGCNLGMESTTRPFVVLLNDDAVVTPGWLSPLLAYMTAHEHIAAVQPKILNLDQPGMFDYAGASGGLMDVLGFPFARGRMFTHLEADHGQYDSVTKVFWASGACAVMRRSVLDQVGLLDETFFAHMEEIDLNWRMLLAGFDVACVPDSVVRHNAGSTLAQHAPMKLYLNHRNSLVMLLKNYGVPNILWVFPVRMGLELASAAQALLLLRFAQAWAIVRSWFAVIPRLGHIRRARRARRDFRARTDAEVGRFMYRGCLVWQYYARGRRTSTALTGET